MKLVTFTVDIIAGKITRIGALIEDHIVDLNLAYARYLQEAGSTERPYEIATALLPHDMIEFFKGGALSTEAAQSAIAYAGQSKNRRESFCGPAGEKILYALGEVTIMAPVLRPASIRDTMSFEGHMKAREKRTGKPTPELWYQIPAYYKGNPGSVIGPNVPIISPKYTEQLDYELEFGIYIGRQGKNIPLDKAAEYIAGYTIFNDVSARDQQQKERTLLMGSTKGKDFDTGNVMGPCLVTPDELDVGNLMMSARINGETWSQGNTSDMYWTFPQIIEYISRSETLYPGDFIGSGTIANGCGDEMNRFIKPGDVIELEVEGIGILKNQVVSEGEA